MKHLKTVLLSMGLIALIALAGCGHSGVDANDLSGVYVRSFEGEFSVGIDTLKLVKRENGSDEPDQYTIQRTLAYQKIIDGEMQVDTLYKHQSWRGMYDPEHQILKIRPSGKALTVDKERQEISLGEGIYHKIKE
ncbi:hypothetical protein [Arachidicoccus terrestris]|uniref:hypothetical protein n=1 Tax=Arachidicoccus terrestris TaxID=2875539 RepID=UPI001CC6E689|nr:hypothetical protein [Arachidicoccus terrestris]UAY55768.1 hypothetical protein K9M52_01660 [Arachidicoccus terrestris]